jgi:hypothetical protein
MRKLPFILLSILVFCGGLVAQSDCPEIDLSGPSSLPNPGDPVTFTVQVDTRGKDLKLEYVWSISVGEIVSGQGTSEILVKRRNSNDNVTTTVEIRGLPVGCPNTQLGTMGCDSLVPEPQLIETFRGPITAKDKVRFEKFLIALSNDPSARAVFFMGGPVARIKANRRMIMRFLPLHGPLRGSRIMFVDTRSQFERTELWIVPAGAK